MHVISTWSYYILEDKRFSLKKTGLNSNKHETLHLQNIMLDNYNQHNKLYLNIVFVADGLLVDFIYCWLLDHVYNWQYQV